ncbi:hypothetical protein LARV_00988 [Longilinea arvoryzae]|uniref:Uncharacterized protein n=1 Tax=Longilinea arvoryzae TaxID=360412 RepID=A0A0S7BHI8_9CHLR|nr:hypothetical protein [Longilinea arvoryzae]GAP13237.1 hypothetical protein LARV_00988 [Longilinea arvoryzae]
MNVYEDKYLRDKISRIIARQKEGKVVIAAYKDGSGLPAREDLGQALARAAYPHDYAVGSAGFLNFDSELGAYLYTAKPGVKQPEVITRYQPLSLAEAELIVQERQVCIRAGDTAVTFSGVQTWKGMYEILREINEELARVNAGIVVWKIIPKEGNYTEPADRLFSGAVPRLRNGQALGHVTGYAFDDDHALAYIGLVSYKTSLESLRITLMTGKPLQMVQDGVGDHTLIPNEKYEQAWQAMPEYTSHHAAFLSRLATPGKWEPEDLIAYLLVFRDALDPNADLIRLFIERLKEALEIPILDSWSAVLWKQASNRKYIQKMNVGGDCILGAKIDLQADWQELLSNLLAEKAIALTA